MFHQFILAVHLSMWTLLNQPNRLTVSLALLLLVQLLMELCFVFCFLGSSGIHCLRCIELLLSVQFQHRILKLDFDILS